ncbi:MAG TPA: protein kinase [Ktedonobacteraceae bacterium]
MSDLEGVMLSEYFLLQCIRRGGVADVYRARQNGEDSYEVAVKVYRPGYAQRDSFREYFMAEAEKIGQFDHPHILPFLEFGEGEGLLYAVTPFVATGTLEDLLGRVGGRLSALQALPIIQQVCDAVQYAHEHAVIHGNIKPGNVFVGADGRMLLADFGIARGYDDSQQSLTRVGWGSAEYTAPEQSLGVLRRSSDIYALGVLLYRVLTGQPPFTGQTPVEVLLKHVRQQPPSARLIVPSISDGVNEVIHRALQKRADDRFSSAEELSKAILAAVSVAPVATPVAKAAADISIRQAISQQSPSVSNPLTPLPSLSTSLIGADPQTPVPAHFALSSPSRARATTSVPSPGYTTPTEMPQQPSTVTIGGSENAENRQKDALRENSVAGKPRFWMVDPDPVEWSPITRAKVNLIPLNADAYLSNQSVVIGPEVQSPVPAPQSAEKEGEHIEEKAQSLLAARLRKLLPVVVVILLLLGLLGALLSSFYFPGDKSGTFLMPHHSSEQSAKSVLHG